MSKAVKLFVLSALCAALCLNVVVSASSPVTDRKPSVSAAGAIDHLGDLTTVCGLVVNTKFAHGSRGRPTFINLDKPYPDHVFTIVIWGTDRHKFRTAPETYLTRKRICVKGVISSYRGKAQIIVSDPSQISVLTEDE